MFNNIGGKIKVLAKVLFWVVIAVFGLGLIFGANGNFLSTIISLLPLVLLSTMGSFVLYGFGELVESAMVLRDGELKRQRVEGQRP